MAVKKIIHLSDIHIRTYRYHEEYTEVFHTLYKQISDILNEYERDEVRIVVTGDIVHQKIVISNEMLLMVSSFLRNLEELAPVIIIAGNHDLLESNSDRLDSISPVIDVLGDKDINYFKDSKCFLDNNIVWCVYSIFEGHKRPDIEAARVQFGNDKRYVGLFHAPILSAKTDIGYEIDHGASMDIFEGCDMVLLGDIHKRQSFNHKGIKIAYPSSLIQQNFGENVSKHGFLLWDVETKDFVEYDIENDTPFYVFKINSPEDLDNDKEVIVNL